MRKTVFTYGLIAGGIITAFMAVGIPICMNATAKDFATSELIGYTSMVLSFVAVFLGIRSYRENAGGGTITFGRAFKVGILISLVASAIYVISWEIIYFNFVPDFADKFAAITIDKLRADGASATEIVAAEKKMAEFKRLYANPLFNVGMTFMEIFPVGLIMTLVSAAILRKKPTPPAGAAATAVA